MAAVLVEYLEDAEPLTFGDVARQCRIDGNDEREHIETVVIPTARQAAETKSGAAIRKARYVERLAVFPQGEFSLAIGQVEDVESVVWRSPGEATSPLPPALYEVVQAGRDTYLAPTSAMGWPTATAVTITYVAGTDLEKFPSVRSWMLLAAAWVYEQRELFGSGQVEMPSGFAEMLLAPITVSPRF